MINLIKKDLRLVFNRKAILIVFLMISVLIVSTSRGDGYGIYNLIVFSVYISTLGFLNSNDKEDILIHSLPVNNYDVVLGKYILMFILFIVGSLIISVLSVIIYGLNLINDISYLNLGFFQFTLLLTMFFCSIGIPLMLYFGVKSNINVFLSGMSFYFIFMTINNRISERGLDFIYMINSPLISAIILVLMIISMILSLNGFKNWTM